MIFLLLKVLTCLVCAVPISLNSGIHLVPVRSAPVHLKDIPKGGIPEGYDIQGDKTKQTELVTFLHRWRLDRAKDAAKFNNTKDKESLINVQAHKSFFDQVSNTSSKKSLLKLQDVTQVPTEASTQVPSTEEEEEEEGPQEYFVHDGSGDGDSILSDKTETHGVRCCSESEKHPTWTKLVAKTCPDIWGTSLQDTPAAWNSQCRKLNWDGAKAACEGAGGRLCTVAEIEADCTSGTGCGLDKENVWTSDTAEEEEEAGPQEYFVHEGSGDGDSILSDKTEKHGVRCCSESEKHPTWTKLVAKTCPDIWGTSLQDTPAAWNSQCRKLNWDGAKAACGGAGGRLCTVAEIEADCTSGTGCGLDKENVWTSDTAA